MIDLNALRTQAADILETGEVGAVIGWRRGSRGMAAEPVAIVAPEEAASLVWDPTCFHNLALYLVEERKKPAQRQVHGGKPIAIVAKGCDARAVTVLLQENHFGRDDVYVIGVSCEGTGVLDERKLAQVLPGVEPDGAAFDGDNFVFATSEGERRVPAREAMMDRCLECRNAHPKLNNVVFGEETPRDFDAPFAALKRFEQRPAAERWQFWQRQFERCIRCFACRSVCPMCYCDECVVDSINLVVTPETTAAEKADRVRWIERSASRADNIGYHMTRALHLAGRCVDCGECERVCPVNIPLRLLNNKMEREAREAFGYEPGASIDLPALVASFRDDDPGQFIR
ncbi:MAG: 4Fe-4S dicluster domain-containing protein [Sulfurisoma sp.]|nr:4Fe-4S dicluster domain-containing protein [Sulfurisoma sp.]